jgi:hypothetical protein
MCSGIGCGIGWRGELMSQVWQIGPGAWPNLGTVLAQGAQAFDTVMLLQSGSPYSGAIWDVSFPLPLHVVGEPGAVPVSCRNFHVALADTPAAQDWWIEGLRIIRSGTGTGAVRMLPGASWGGMRLVLHQCEHRAALADGVLNGNGAGAGQQRVILVSRCAFWGARAGGQLIDMHADDAVSLERVELDRTLDTYVGAALEDVVAEADYVTAPVPGYGPDYQSFLNPIVAQPRAMSGTLLLEGGSHDRAQILVYRVLDDGAAESAAELEGHAWRVVRPDPVTGYWEVRLLPTTRSDGSPQRYAYTIWTPEGYGPQTHGRYLPAPAP